MLALVLVLGAWTAQAAVGGYAATRKGRSFNAWTVAGLFVGPVVILVALVVPQRRVLG